MNNDSSYQTVNDWDKIWWYVHDDEMPINLERIGLALNFLNEHFPDFDTEESLEKEFSEYLEWEGELMEAEQKLEEITKILGREPQFRYLPVEMEKTIKDILEVLNIEF